MFKEADIETTLELPYTLIDIGEDEERFVFAFRRFDENQTDYSIQAGGLTGKFEVMYRCKGMESRFECDITVGNVYELFVALDNAYEGFSGKLPSVVLHNYGNAPYRTEMTFKFEKTGHFIFSGRFMNKSNEYRSGIIIDSIKSDSVFLSDILKNSEKFFAELSRIQGHRNFY